MMMMRMVVVVVGVVVVVVVVVFRTVTGARTHKASEILEESLPNCHTVLHKCHMT
jgi:hypothetical protein